MKVIIHAETTDDRQLALRAVEFLIRHPKKRDVIVSYIGASDFYVYRTRTGAIGVRKC